MKLGKAPFQEDSRDATFSKFVDLSQIAIPDTFGSDGLVDEWGVLGNDDVGNCVFAGAAHETMIFTAEGTGEAAEFTTDQVISDYATVTGYDGTDATDQGTYVRDAMKYRRKFGVRDAAGDRHRIGVYLRLTPGDLEQLYAATYLFSAVGIGVSFPNTAMQQFYRGEPWDVVSGATIEGGHYVPVVGKPLRVVTWGRRVAMTERFYQTYCDEAWAFVSRETLDPETGLSPDGFRLGELVRYLTQVTSL